MGEEVKDILERDTWYFRHINRYVDNRGKERIYVKLPKRLSGGVQLPQIRLRENPSIENREAFTEEYNLAIAGLQRRCQNKRVVGTDTIEHLYIEFKKSPKWRNYNPSTKQKKLGRMDKFMVEEGHKRVATLTAAGVIRIQEDWGENGAKPERGNGIVKDLSAMFSWAIKRRSHLLPEGFTNPCLGIGKLQSNNPQGFYSWTIEEVEKFRTYWPLGTMPRVAIDLMLYTGVRVSDAFRLGRHNEKNGGLEINFRCTKTGREMDVPMLSELRESINALENRQMYYLLSSKNKPFGSAKSFSQWFVKRRREAGLDKRCVPHGLRKAAASFAAEAGATEKELMVIFGWTDPRMAAVYTEQAQRKKIAKSGILTLKGERKKGESS